MQISPSALRAFVIDIFIAGGSAPFEAQEIADHLIGANLRGHDSHGVGMIPAYVLHLSQKAVFPNRKPKLVADLGAMAIFDGDMGYGQPAANAVMDDLAARTVRTGIALCALRNVQHVGRIGAYGERLAAKGLLSIHFVNAVYAQPAVAPFRGSDARLMTNPVCITAPLGPDRPPVVLDFATSAIALGKVRVAMNKGVETPADALIDHKGQPTRDPRQIFEEPKGAILPFGLHKGWGLAFIVETLGGVLTGGPTEAQADKPAGVVNGMLSIAIDQARLTEGRPYFADVAALIDYVKASPPANPAEPVLVPGEPERAHMAEREKGVPIDETTWREIVAAARSLGVVAPVA